MLAKLRWAFMPLGLTALLAVGIHAAADTVCERLLFAVDRFAAGFDHLAGQLDFTAGLVGAISFAARTRVARGVTLCWELAADLVLALPALGYRERIIVESWKALATRALQAPTTLRVTRPLQTAAFALAGACAVARMVQATTYLTLLHALSGGHASAAARALAVLVVGAIAVALGIRAVRRSLESADLRSREDLHRPEERILVGLIGSALCLPLAVAALLQASPLLAFFR
jgi:hypothetical protein